MTSTHYPKAPLGSQASAPLLARSHVVFEGGEVGFGRFGQVVHGTLKFKQEEIDVAIKLPCEHANAACSVLAEACILAQFSHPNILQLFGVVQDSAGRVLGITKYCQ